MGEPKQSEVNNMMTTFVDVGPQQTSSLYPDIEANDYYLTNLLNYDSGSEIDPNYESHENYYDETEIEEEDDGDGGSELGSGGESSSDDEWIVSRRALKDKRKNVVAEEPSGNIDADFFEEQVYSFSDTSDDEAPKRRPTFKTIDEVDTTTNFKALVWKVGMKFSSPKIFKDTVNRYAIIAGYSITWYKSEKRRMAAKCKDGCPWNVYASWDGNKETFIVKAVSGTHSCNRMNYENIQLKPKWLAKEYLLKYKTCPNWPARLLAQEVMEKYGVRISKYQCHITKLEAHKILYLSLQDHYMMLGSYIHELKRVDPNTTSILLTQEPNIPRGPEVFKRLYMGFKGLREGFMTGCRPILCFDGCFLKTFLGGMLLSAIGRDGNNQMYPVAWAVVEAENNDSWSWFLEMLKNDLPGFGGEDSTIISDQQKGLTKAVREHFPLVEHRNCARHIYANWRKKHSGEQMKGIFWKAAKAYTRSDFDVALEEMRLISAKAVEDFICQNPNTFCRSYLRTLSKSDVIVSNLAETFNGYILDARSKPIIGMMEEIRLAIMARLFKRRKLMVNGKPDDICPRIKKILEREKENAKKCIPIQSDISMFQVMHLADMVYVNLEARTCSYRKWDLTGIPCCHVVACCEDLRVNCEVFVFDCYKKVKFDLSYGQPLQPINGHKQWDKVKLPLVPPPIKIGAGRPTKNRRKDPHERVDKPGKLTRHGMVMTCTKCNGKNHNKRSCPARDNVRNDVASQNVTKKRGGRPRKETSETSATQSLQPARPRGRPRKGTNTILPTNENNPSNMGVYFSEQSDRAYLNTGLPDAPMPSQTSSTPGPSKP